MGGLAAPHLQPPSLSEKLYSNSRSTAQAAAMLPIPSQTQIHLGTSEHVIADVQFEIRRPLQSVERVGRPATIFRSPSNTHHQTSFRLGIYQPRYTSLQSCASIFHSPSSYEPVSRVLSVPYWSCGPQRGFVHLCLHRWGLRPHKGCGSYYVVGVCCRLLCFW